MKTTTVETSRLSGSALDWAVAKAVPYQDHPPQKQLGIIPSHYAPPFSTDWELGGPLIQDHVVAMGEDCSDEDEPFYAETRMCAAETGETYLIAACRAVVAGRFGSEVEVPSELVEEEES